MSSNTKSAGLRPRAAVLTVGAWIAAVWRSRAAAAERDRRRDADVDPRRRDDPQHAGLDADDDNPAGSSSRAAVSPGNGLGTYSGAYTGTFTLDWTQNGRS